MTIRRLRALSALLLFALVVGVLSACATSPAATAKDEAAVLRVMTFNVRYASPNDGVNLWENRRALTLKTIVEQQPDLIGMQELLLGQATWLGQQLPHHAWFGKGRNGNEVDGNGNEHMGLFYDTRRLTLLRQGDFWYSETPDVPGSANFDGPMPRMATWGEFEDRRNGKRFFLFNTHLPHTDAAEALRERCARLLLARIQQLAGDAPVVVTGDFNAHPDGPTHRLLTAELSDAWDQAPARSGPEKTAHAFTGNPDARIDWVLYRQFGIRSVHSVDDHEGPLYPSDHYPVVAELTWL
ncbi:endonuclease/exonuclease/phosphatase family protein [Stenotrophomonas sp. PS02289]|uniref:endonuclease/exonuclease/phosphatase family protein n=1 Tax=Stenotrophomonas sp. PS02289 TaxID=2991422 RepID=UPI00249BCC61|nr:endonuclease/exonuclease/phosphatase family protein [Stenotrophomonas sp. PS02289]